MLTFVDSNVFVRLFVEDDGQQRSSARKLLQQALCGIVDLVTGPPVFFEIAWVLSHTYKVENDKILSVLEAILSFPNLRVLDKELVTAALYLARKANGTFADSYIAVSAGRMEADNLATFNKKHFSRLGIKLYPLEGDQ